MNNLDFGKGTTAGRTARPMAFPEGVNPDTRRRLQKAALAQHKSRFEAERLLWEARAEDPGCLSIYVVMHAFYANARRLNDAIRVSRLALAEAASQGGFSPDWTKLNVVSVGSTYVDLYASEAGLFYLAALKSLALLTLRQKKVADAISIIRHLIRLDTDNLLGHLAIRSPHGAAHLSFQVPTND